MWSIIPKTPPPIAHGSRALPVTSESLDATTGYLVDHALATRPSVAGSVEVGKVARA